MISELTRSTKVMWKTGNEMYHCFLLTNGEDIWYESLSVDGIGGTREYENTYDKPVMEFFMIFIFIGYEWFGT